ncbi:MAG: hypothetical protein ACP5IE_09930 [Infirmifilum sp.]
MEIARQYKLNRIKSEALKLVKNVAITDVRAKEIKSIAYYDWKNDLIVINENVLDHLSEDCLTYIVVHELVHKMAATRNHDARFLAKLLSIYNISDIIKYETEITAFGILNHIPRNY